MSGVSTDDWLSLIDDKEITKRRKKAEDRYRDLSSDQVTYIRKRAKMDLFFFSSGILEYKLLSVGLHGHLCRWLEETRDEQYRLELLARGHYKSTIITIAESCQMALPNEAGVQSHPHCLGPDIKLLLGHENRESASRFLYEITEAFTAKPAMLAFFPDLIPSPRKQRMNKWELELPRQAHHKEPTFDTIGAGGAAQGRHYNWLKLDDLVGEDARDSETVMKRILNWFDNVNALLTRLSIDGWDLTGTRWAYVDVYSHAIKRYGIKKSRSVLNCFSKKEIERINEGLLCVYGRSAIEKGEPVFPEEFTVEKLNILRQNQKVWAAQYANNPLEGSLTLFNPGHLKFYNVGANGRLYVFAGDSTFSVSRRELDILIFIDPSMGETDDSDSTGVVVTGTDKRLNVFLLEAYEKRMKPPELIEELFRLYTQYWPRAISIEAVNFSGTYRYWFEEKCAQLRMYPNIVDYKVGKREKIARIRGLTNYFAAGQVYCQEGMLQFREQYEQYPLGNDEHILDALAQGPELWTPGLTREDQKDNTRAVEALLENRDAMTGY